MVSELKKSQIHDSTVNANVSGVKEHYEHCNFYQAEKDKKSDDRISEIIPAIVKHSEENQSLADENKFLKRENFRLKDEMQRTFNTMKNENLAISNNLLASLKLVDEMKSSRKCRSLSNYSSVR